MIHAPPGVNCRGRGGGVVVAVILDGAGGDVGL